MSSRSDRGTRAKAVRLAREHVLIAQYRGRAVYLVRWDVARRVFETHPAGSRYPEVEGVTHPAIRWACGLWVRDAVLRWHLDHSEFAPLLIGEAPLVGNRFVEGHLARWRVLAPANPGAVGGAAPLPADAGRACSYLAVHD
jgi:hypothetical protein